jgi:transposase-like protein
LTEDKTNVDFSKFKCDDCGESFDTPDEYAVHSKIHYPDRVEKK